MGELNSNNFDKYLTFTVENQQYCINIASVTEIKGYSSTTKFPHSLEYMLGVINIRGNIIPIFDLKARFGFGKSEINQKKVIILVSYHANQFGLLVDTVDNIVEGELNQIKDSVTARSALSEDFIKGTILVDQKIFIILNLSSLIHEELFQDLKKMSA